MRNRALSYGLTFVLAGVLVGACATKEVRDGFGDGDPADAGSGGSITNETDAQGIGSDNGGAKVELEGTTYAPNGDLELAGVLVYWTLTEPKDIPEGVYCDTCVELPEGTSVISGVDGTFKLKVPAAAEFYLVVQKGQFRRVRKLTMALDDTKFDDEDTTLPGKMKVSEGDTIPTIAIMDEENDPFDPIHEALGKLGIEEYDSFGGDHSQTEIDNLRKYNVLLLPCGSTPSGEEEISNIQTFAQEGGKVYVSDYALPYINQMVPGIAENLATGRGSDFDSGCGDGACADGQFPEPGLNDWMTALGDTSVEFQGIYSNMDSLASEIEVPGTDGALTMVQPKVWTEAKQNDGTWVPASFSFNYGCGRGMFSIFHAHGKTPELIPQEKALLYILLEVSACVRPGGDVN